LHEANKLPPESLDALHAATDAIRSVSGFGNITERLLEVSRYESLAPTLTESERLALTGCCRDPDARVREVAMNVCSRVLGDGTHDDDALVWGLVSGLFDPVDDVVQAALRAVASANVLTTDASRQVAVDRMPRVYQSARSSTRAVVVVAARRLLSKLPNSGLDALVAEAERDKSWRVRRATAEPLPDR
jgi:hypothetical protein